MSYILDALRKSEQQRQRGTTPTLQGAQVAVVAPRRTMPVAYALLAAMLLVAGVIIGLLRPWQQQPAAEEKQLALNPPAAKQADSPVVAATPAIPASTAQDAVAHVHDRHAGDATIPIDELPAAIRLEIPAMAVQMHVYSGKPGERMVNINSVRLREGELLMPGLKLEQITKDGMIFSYKGYRFQRGIR